MKENQNTTAYPSMATTSKVIVRLGCFEREISVASKAAMNGDDKRHPGRRFAQVLSADQRVNGAGYDFHSRLLGFALKTVWGTYPAL